MNYVIACKSINQIRTHTRARAHAARMGHMASRTLYVYAERPSMGYRVLASDKLYNPRRTMVSASFRSFYNVYIGTRLYKRIRIICVFKDRPSVCVGQQQSNR